MASAKQTSKRLDDDPARLELNAARPKRVEDEVAGEDGRHLRSEEGDGSLANIQFGSQIIDDDRSVSPRAAEPGSPGNAPVSSEIQDGQSWAPLGAHQWGPPHSPKG